MIEKYGVFVIYFCGLFMLENVKKKRSVFCNIIISYATAYEMMIWCGEE